MSNQQTLLQNELFYNYPESRPKQISSNTTPCVIIKLIITQGGGENEKNKKHKNHRLSRDFKSIY